LLLKEQRSHNNAAVAAWVAWAAVVIQVVAVIQVGEAAIQAEEVIRAGAIRPEEGIQTVGDIQMGEEDIQTAVEDTRTATAVRPP
jgi:hypothetical protein